MTTKDGCGPLSGLIVTDLSRVLSGPLAGMLLGDLGARVMKVERPSVGDDTRRWGPPFVGQGQDRVSTYFLALNRNKESIELDFHDPADVHVLRRMIARSDVVIENFRPHVLRRIGLDPERMIKLNPRLIVLSISGFGSHGAGKGRPGYDQIVQGEAGLMSLTGDTDGPPMKSGVPIADILAGSFGVTGVLAALHEREVSGRGQVVRTSLYSSIIASHTFQATRWLLGGDLPRGTGNMHPIVAPYGSFECADGYIQIAAGNDGAWERTAAVLGIDGSDPRFIDNESRVANRDELVKLMTDSLKQDSCLVWVDRLDRAGVPAGRIQSLEQVYQSDMVRDGNLLMTVHHPTLGDIRLPGPPVEFSDGHYVASEPPPLLGQHSSEIRRWALSGE